MADKVTKGRNARRLRIAYDARLLVHDRQPSGIPVYARELVTAIAQWVDPVLLTDGPGRDEDIPGEWLSISRMPGWQQVRLPGTLLRIRPDVFHSLHFTLPLSIRCPSVVTIHDLAFWNMPEVVEKKTRDYLRRWVPPSLRVATRIIVPSHHVKEELVRTFRVDPQRVAVVPHGVGAPFTSRKEPSESAPLPWPYLLAVATLDPRKNLGRVIGAFSLEVRRVPALEHHLILVGRPGCDEENIRRIIAEHQLVDRVHLLGYVPREAVARLYRHAALLLFPSLYEGFGLPALEAMMSECMVVTSADSAMSEFVGEFGVQVDPHHVEAIAVGIREGLRRSSSAATAAFAQQFTWDRSALATVAVYRQAVGGG